LFKGGKYMAFKKISALYFMADSTEDLINLPDV
jgi:hypothetical protein